MSGPTAHALFSASGAPAWMRCAPKLAAERGKPDSSSAFADEGTAAHSLASWVLESHVAKAPLRAEDWKGETIKVGERIFTVDDDMAGHVQTYVDNVLHRIEQFKLRGAVSVELLVEVRVDYSSFLGVPDSFGTSDVVLLVEWPGDVWQIDVDDLKYGMGVKVYAEHNEQMMLYALGAYDQFSAIVGNVETVSMAIHQPRIGHLDEWECSLADLLAFGEEAKAAAARAAMYLTDVTPSLDDFTPGEKQCRFCKAAPCPALDRHVIRIVSADFDDISPPVAAPEIADAVLAGTAALKDADNARLDSLYPSFNLVEIWLKAGRAAIERAALAGAVFENCKLVQGKRGDRKWSSEEEAEKAMKSMRLKSEQMYQFKLITPTAAEKMAPRLAKTSPKGGEIAMGVKTPIGVKQWARLKELIVQSDGGLSVAAASDKRPAVVVQPVANDFDEVPEPDDFSDLA